MLSVNSTCISPGRGTGSGSRSPPVDRPNPCLWPTEQHILPRIGIGITTWSSGYSRRQRTRIADLREGATQLEAKAAMSRLRCVAVLGVQAYRKAFL